MSLRLELMIRVTSFFPFVNIKPKWIDAGYRIISTSAASLNEQILIAEGGGSPCQSNPCVNNGVCSDEDGKYTCKCPPGFIGKDCQIKDREY